VAKKKGKRLGRNAKKLSRRNRKAANDFARKMKPTIQKLFKDGYTTIRAIREELNKRQIPTFRPGCQWHITTVYNLLERLKK